MAAIKMQEDEFERSLYAVPPRKRFKLLEKQRVEQERQLEEALRLEQASKPKKAKDLGQRLLEEEGPEAEDTKDAGAVALEELVAKKSGITSRICAPGKQEAEEKEKAEEEGEDGVLCDVCRGGDADPIDPIVFCDGCDVAVHTSCYGNPLCRAVPEGDWFCSRCQEGQGQSESCCCLCPSRTGAMKRTTDGQWAHLSCALFVPEVFFGCGEGREPVDCGKLPGKRRRMLCSVCGAQGGACVQCSETGCGDTFHVTCGLDREFAFEYQNSAKGGVVVAFCERHTPAWEQLQELRQRRGFRIVSRAIDDCKRDDA